MRRSLFLPLIRGSQSTSVTELPELMQYFNLTAGDFNNLSGELIHVNVINGNGQRFMYARFDYDSTRDLIVDIGGLTTPGPIGIQNIRHHALVPNATQSVYANILPNQVPGGGNDAAGLAATTFANGIGAFIGGNHGWPSERCEHTGHGFVPNDCGSLGTDANGNLFRFVEVVNANEVRIIGERTENGDGLWELQDVKTVASPVVFATPTGNKTLAIQSRYHSELYDIVGDDRILDHYKNGVLIDETVDATHTGITDWKICERYPYKDIYSAIEIWNANRPAGAGYLTNPSKTIGDTIVTFRNLYDLSGMGTFTLYYSIEVHTDKITRIDHVATQHEFHTLAWSTKHKRHIPNELPFTVGADTYDMRVGHDFAVAPMAITRDVLYPADVEAGKKLYRVWDRVAGTLHGGYEHNFNVSYLPEYNSFDDEENIRVFAHPGSQKIYLYGFSQTPIAAGTIKGVQIIATSPEPDETGIANDVTAHAYGAVHRIMDFDAAGTYEIEVPAGQTLTVADISSEDPDDISVTGNSGTVTVDVTTVPAYVIVSYE